MYHERSAERLLRRQPGGRVKSSTQYLGITVSHPVTMGKLFVEHIFNGFDQRYSTPYAESLAGTGRRPVRMFGFLLVFLAVLRLSWPSARRRLEPARWRYVTALAVFCVTSIPSAIETRFFLPLYLLNFVLVVAAGWPNPLPADRRGFRRYRTAAAIAGSLVVFMAVAVAVTNNATDNLEIVVKR